MCRARGEADGMRLEGLILLQCVGDLEAWERASQRRGGPIKRSIIPMCLSSQRVVDVFFSFDYVPPILAEVRCWMPISRFPL